MTCLKKWQKLLLPAIILCLVGLLAFKTVSYFQQEHFQAAAVQKNDSRKKTKTAVKKKETLKKKTAEKRKKSTKSTSSSITTHKQATQDQTASKMRQPMN